MDLRSAARARYWFGPFVLDSPLALAAPAAAACDTIAPVLRLDWHPTSAAIDSNWTHHWRDGSEIVLSLAHAGPAYWLRAPGIADFLLEPGEARCLMAADAGLADPATLEHLLVDQVLPRLLAQRGDLLVHASAVAIAGCVALFLAPSGYGKSTLAALLHARGHRVLSDDCVLLDAAQGMPRVAPTYPSLRLYPDSLGVALPAVTATGPVAGYSAKRRVPMAASPGTWHGVDALYVLGDPREAGETVLIRALRPAEACLALIRHSFRLDLGDRVASTRQLAQCSRIANQVPAFLLDYPRDFEHKDALLDALAIHLANLSR